MHFTAGQPRDLSEGLCCIRIVLGADCECDEDLLHMQVRVMSSQTLHLQLLDRLDDFRRDEFDVLVNPCQSFESV